MGFKDIKIQRRYKSVGENLTCDIVNELLKCSMSYKRSVGYFKSSALDFINDGINYAIDNKCKIQILTSPVLYKEDIEAIKLGYKNRNDVIGNRFSIEFREALSDLNNENLIILAQLVSLGLLDIKILSKKDFGIFHYKVAIFEDYNGDQIVLAGSNNETAGGYGIDYDIVRSFKSWVDYEDVLDEEMDFESMWNGEDPYLDTYNFNEAIYSNIIEEAKTRNIEVNLKSQKEVYKLYDYQKEAISAWVNNKYNGFFVMATGTGKTITSLYAAKKLIDFEEVVTVIAVPYKHLVLQWGEDVEKIFGDKVDTYYVSSEFPSWDIKLKTAFMNRNYNSGNKIIIITTIKSFYGERFNNAMKINKDKRLLIVDEAHNFLNQVIEQKYDINYEYKLGLSATPIFGIDSSKTDILCGFFGGIVYELPIEKAIGKFLVNYTYTPIFVNASEEDENKFKYYSRKLMYLRDPLTGVIKDKTQYNIAYRGRLRAIAMAEEKINNINDIISSIDVKDHFIIYCSDGKIGDIRHLQTIIDLLNDNDYKPSQFTCEENMMDRARLIQNFNDGYISSLIAIRCLDEGINIPSIKTALILSSNDNYREFVQRRGRILRKYKGKEVANIIDVIVLPSLDCKQIAEIELRRFNEYAKLALNKDELMKMLNDLLNKYDLEKEDILFNNEYLDMEDESDE